jgi:peptide-methionine (S)-S-oxide reductase
VKNPTYEQVCRGTTGHAEVVRVVFDPAVISYRDILDVFFAIHDPTTKDRQGVDFGSQYRSAIFFHGPEQEQAARASKASRSAGLIGKRRLLGLAGPARIVTEIAPASTFNEAEDYHQNYLGQRCAARVG